MLLSRSRRLSFQRAGERAGGDMAFSIFEVTRVSGRAGVGHARRGGRPPKDTILPIQLQRTGYMGPRMSEKKDHHGPRTDGRTDTPSDTLNKSNQTTLCDRSLV